MPAPRIFARITKIDEARRLVYGRATEEIVDRADELFDYESSKPNFQKWSAECFKDSGGKSLGNIRAMHGPIAAGKLTDITFDDAEKAIDVVSKCVDDNEWNKILEGVYTGYSIGGSYAKKWADKVDGNKVTRYTALPAEISYVDRPCVPTAKFFDVVKTDGSLAKIMFKAFESPTDSTSGIAPHGGDPKQKKRKVKKMALRKGCESVSAFADLIQRLKWLGDSAQWEKDYEGDESDLPGKIKGKTAELLTLLAEMAIEEAGELTAAEKAAGALARADGAGNPSAAEPSPNAAQPLQKREDEAMADPVKDPVDPKLAKTGAPETGGKSGSPSGSEVQSSNKADDADAETTEERDARLDARKKKAASASAKAAGLPSSKEEFDASLAKAAEAGAEKGVRMFAKMLGIDPEAAFVKPEDAAAALNKGAPAAATKRPALFAVGKDGNVAKVTDPAELAKSVDPVPGDNGKDPMKAAATLIKAIHASGPHWYEDDQRRPALAK